MKIYQLHEYSGEYEDFIDYIIGSYFRKERAEEEKAKAEALEKEFQEKSQKCANCPFVCEDFSDLDGLLMKYPDYCENAKGLEEYEFGIYCDAQYVHWDEATYKIKEVEVEE